MLIHFISRRKSNLASPTLGERSCIFIGAQGVAGVCYRVLYLRLVDSKDGLFDKGRKITWDSPLLVRIFLFSSYDVETLKRG